MRTVVKKYVWQAGEDGFTWEHVGNLAPLISKSTFRVVPGLI